MSPVCKMAENGRLTVDQKVKVVLFYAETKSVVATQRCFRAHFCTRWAPCKQTIYSLSLGKIFQPMRINSVPDVKCFCNNKNVLRVQSMIWHFVRHSVCSITYPENHVVYEIMCKNMEQSDRPQMSRKDLICLSDDRQEYRHPLTIINTYCLIITLYCVLHIARSFFSVSRITR